MNTEYIRLAGLQVAKPIYALVNDEIIPGTGIDAEQFWQGAANIITELGAKNRALLAKRDDLQAQIDEWHKQHRGSFDFASYKGFLQGIGYLVPEPESFKASTENVDPEIAEQAGPQLVVPVMNARFALNAANARWGSLYDALYGSDIIDEQYGAGKVGAYNPVRGAKVIAYAKDFLNATAPLKAGKYQDVSGYAIVDKALQLTLANGDRTELANPALFIGFKGEPSAPSAVLLKHNRLHIELQFDRNHLIGSEDDAGLKDVLMEAALTTIMDCEDSVAAVDAEDKALVYRNWLGLMKGDLQEIMHRGDKTSVRKLNPDRSYNTVDGGNLTLPGRSLLFVRNVGHLMTNPAMLDAAGGEVFEGIMDALITSLSALHDLKKGGKVGADSGLETEVRNAKQASVYIVKPKMHGPEEVAFTDELFARVEQLLSLPSNTLKVGIMDEERRTSVNLAACIKAVSQRVVFINTGFLDRTGDEIHTSMEAGAFAPKADLKTMRWIGAYENRNVDVGLKCGLQGRAQIGKGMWPIPDNMADMMATKIAHPQAGANTAWVPSPTAAVLHALHYHQCDVLDRQQTLASRQMANVDDILTIPLLDRELSEAEIATDLGNNIQAILGYVVRWVEQGIGCSKVPDINNVGLMEDRATLRIASQHIANWLHHGIINEQQVRQLMADMAKVVDGQNADDPLYKPMSDNLEKSIAFKAAQDLIFKGLSQPSGYTEPLLHAYRRQFKQA